CAAAPRTLRRLPRSMLLPYTTLFRSFPDTPVALQRIDGHAYLVNSKAMELAGITAKTKIPGGEVVLENGEPTGILIDSPMDLIEDRKSTRLNSSHVKTSYAVFCLKKK